VAQMEAARHVRGLPMGGAAASMDIVAVRRSTVGQAGDAKASLERVIVKQERHDRRNRWKSVLVHT
jgi:hypothetical protein